LSGLTGWDRRWSGLAVPHLAAVLVAGQVLFFLAGLLSPTGVPIDQMALDPRAVAGGGEYWRLITFLFIPPDAHPIFLVFAWYLFYLMGTALENRWGAIRFNQFILIGWLATAAVSFLPPGWPVTNAYLAGSVFLAFAFLFPDFQILLFFVLPVRIKWLALLAWLHYAWAFLAAPHWTDRFAILAAVANVLLFFGRDIALRLRAADRRLRFQAAAAREARAPVHRCRVCGITDLSHPDTEFRYCTDCKPAQAYCPRHLDDHPHVKETG